MNRIEKFILNSSLLDTSTHSGTNQKTWNEHTKSKFLDRLKIIGSVYCYQDKTYNIWHYNKKNPTYVDYDMDIDINLSYVRPYIYINYGEFIF